MPLTYAKLVKSWLLAISLLFTFAVPPSTFAKSGVRENNSQPHTRVGLASFYGKGFQGKKTADGEKFDKNDITAAHPTYPLGTLLRVTNLANGRAVNVRINDRGPAPKHQAHGVIIDLSEEAARELDFKKQGRARVRTEVLEWGSEPHKALSANAAN